MLDEKRSRLAVKRHEAQDMNNNNLLPPSRWGRNPQINASKLQKMVKLKSSIKITQI